MGPWVIIGALIWTEAALLWYRSNNQMFNDWYKRNYGDKDPFGTLNQGQQSPNPPGSPAGQGTNPNNTTGVVSGGGGSGGGGSSSRTYTSEELTAKYAAKGTVGPYDYRPGVDMPGEMGIIDRSCDDARYFYQGYMNYTPGTYDFYVNRDPFGYPWEASDEAWIRILAQDPYKKGDWVQTAWGNGVGSGGVSNPTLVVQGGVRWTPKTGQVIEI